MKKECVQTKKSKKLPRLPWVRPENWEYMYGAEIPGVGYKICYK